MLLALYLTTTLAADTTVRPPAAAEAAVIEPAVVVHRQPAIPLVALRLAVLADDPPGYAGAGHLVQHLVEGGLRDRVARAGGRVRLDRTSDAVVFTVSGPAAELDYLAGALRTVLVPPAPSAVSLLRARRQLAEERLADWEDPGAHVRAALRARVFPADLPAAGTESAASRLTEAEAVAEAWDAMYSPNRVSIVAVGDVSLSAVEAAFANLPPAGAKGDYAEAVDTVPAQPLAEPQATRGWLGAAYPAESAAAAVSVATRIVGDLLRAELPAAAVESEHWWTHHGQALALIVAVPGSEIPLARRAMASALATAREEVSATSVALAARALRRDMLFYARTPERMAEVIGAFSDRHGEPDAADRFYADLERLRMEDVRRAIDRMLDEGGFTAEVPPQPLPRS